MLIGVSVFQLWRSWQLEARLQETEISRALLLGERILQRAQASPELWARLPAEHRFFVRADRVVVDDQIAWLEPLAAAADEDAVVANRLDRAARAEFVDRDQAAAAREFDELLAGPLLANQRLQVLATAAWQAKRAGAAERLASLQASLIERIGELDTAALASATAAAAVAAAVRLDGNEALQRVVQPLLPYLPPVPFAALSVDEGLRTQHRAIVARRARMLTATQHLAEAGAAATPGMHPAAHDDVLWLLPVAAGATDGTRRAAVLRPAEWFAAVVAAGRDGELPEWPRWIEPAYGPADEVAFLGVPGLRDIARRAQATMGSRTWLLPVSTALLLSGFALAVVQHLRAARREAAAVAAQAQFLTTVTHELKTPLAGIRLLGEMLAEGRANGREVEYYRLLVGEASRLSTLIDNVLDLGRLERGERSYAPRPIAIGEVVSETLAMFTPVAEQDRLHIACDDQSNGSLVRADRGALVQALIALLDNARKYGASGGRIDVSVRGSAAAMMVAVRDHGPGVPAGERERVFERFVRGVAHRHGSTPGVGIGLYLARSIVRRFGGDLTCAAPELGTGAEFRLLLPREVQG